MAHGFVVKGRIYKTIGEAGRAAGLSTVVYKQLATGQIIGISSDDAARAMSAYFKSKIPGFKRLSPDDKYAAIARLVDKERG